jgi:predicted transcriptional regulator
MITRTDGSKAVAFAVNKETPIRIAAADSVKSVSLLKLGYSSVEFNLANAAISAAARGDASQFEFPESSNA